MADERDLELLDDYLTNRMGEQDRSAFEQKLQADPDLQNEYALQQRLIKGIKDARVAQLKSMLNQVSVPANNTGSALASKIIFGAVITMMVVATAWYFMRDKAQQAQQKTSSEQQATPEKPVTRESEPVIQKESAKRDADVAQKQIVESDKNQTSAGTEHSKPSLAKKPDPLQAPADKSSEPATVKDQIDVFNPSTEESKADGTVKDENQPEYSPGASSLVVETDRDNRRYSFHYQFREGKLFLYGPFEKNLYEILEFFTDERRTVFLYYKHDYYLLDEADTNIRPLEPISDPALITKLKEYRLK
jgi:hypothetical protein